MSLREKLCLAWYYFFLKIRTNMAIARINAESDVSANDVVSYIVVVIGCVVVRVVVAWNVVVVV
jgi:hypothetical protein